MPKSGSNFYARFSRSAAKVATAMGTPWAFVGALLIVVGWALTGPRFHYSDTWQLVLNTVTNIITFLMVFLIQNTQNRDTRALHLKLDELIRSGQSASDDMINIENLSEDDLKKLAKKYELIRAEFEARKNRKPAA